MERQDLEIADGQDGTNIDPTLIASTDVAQQSESYSINCNLAESRDANAGTRVIDRLVECEKIKYLS